jgi:hypothetical protein
LRGPEATYTEHASITGGPENRSKSRTGFVQARTKWVLRRSVSRPTLCACCAPHPSNLRSVRDWPSKRRSDWRSSPARARVWQVCVIRLFAGRLENAPILFGSWGLTCRAGSWLCHVGFWLVSRFGVSLSSRPCTHKSRLVSCWSMSALAPKADIRQRIEHVCFVPKADIFHPGFGH